MGVSWLATGLNVHVDFMQKLTMGRAGEVKIIALVIVLIVAAFFIWT